MKHVGWIVLAAALGIAVGAGAVGWFALRPALGSAALDRQRADERTAAYTSLVGALNVLGRNDELARAAVDRANATSDQLRKQLAAGRAELSSGITIAGQLGDGLAGDLELARRIQDGVNAVAGGIGAVSGGH